MTFNYYLEQLFKKIPVVSNVNDAAIFTHHFVQNCSQLAILSHVHTSECNVNKNIGTSYTLILSPFISKLNNSAVETSLCTNGSEVRIPVETIFLFRITYNESLFLQKNAHLVTLIKVFHFFGLMSIWKGKNSIMTLS